MFGRLKSEQDGTQSIDGMRVRQTRVAEPLVLDAKSLPWRSGKSTEETKQQLAEQQQQAELQQARIIKFFGVEAKVEVTPEEIVGMNSQNLKELKRKRANALRKAVLLEDEPKVTAHEREQFLQRLAKAEITNRDEHNFLLLMGEKNPDLAGMLAAIMVDQRQMQILAVAVGKNAATWQQIDQPTLAKFLSAPLGTAKTETEDYRTPVGFLKIRRQFLDGIRPRATAVMYRGYVQAMNALEQTLYGVQLEYYQQFELLRREALKVVQPDGKSKLPLMEAHYESLPAERSSELLGRAVIEGDSWHGGGIERHLTTHQLATARLFPRFLVQYDSMEMSFSEIFQLPGGRVAVLAYVSTRDGVKVRACYRLSNEATWRYLPDYTRRADGKIDTYCVGYGKASVTLPVALQAVLAKLEVKRGVKTLTAGFDPEYIVAGTTYGYTSRQDYQMQWSYGRMRGDYYQEISPDPLNHDFDASGSKPKKAPYTLGIDYQRSPDFTQKLATYELEVAEIGQVHYDSFVSYDGQYNWLFCRDEKGRAWVEAVEAVSPLTTMGLRRDWVALGDLMTPLYEHTNQAGIYGDRTDTKGARQCMWNNYLRNIPLIQQYLQEK